MPISIIHESQALALVGEWLRVWRGTKSTISTKSTKSNPAAPTMRQTSGTSGTFDTFGTFPKIILTPNPEIIVAAQSDQELLTALQSADLSIPDGSGVIWALKILGSQFSVLSSRLQVNRFSVYRSETGKPKTENRMPARLSGLDLMEGMILKGYSLKDPPLKDPPLKVLLLGGRPGVAQAAAKILSEHSENSDSRIVRKSDNQKAGTSGSPNLRQSDFSGSPSFPSVLEIRAVSGPKDITRASKKQLDELVNSINRFRPDLLFVAFGHPKQEKWLTDNRDRLTAGVAMAVGGALDQIADPSLRPPAYINSIGLGWLYRLFRQPWRLKRQLALIKFVFMVVKELVREKILF